jgi:energy-converting hydrogenase Eha subunit A
MIAMSTNSKLNIATLGLRWIARAAGLLSVGVILMFLIGERFNPEQVRTREWVGLAFFPAGVVVGLIVAWWKEGLGSGITLASLAAFYGVYGWLMGSNVHSWWFIVFASPGFFFLVAWLLSKSNVPEVTAKS